MQCFWTRNSAYKKEDAVKYFQNAESLPFNVIIFPKSISEFTDDEFNSICDALRGAEFDPANDKIHFLISFRKDPKKYKGPSQSDLVRCEMIKNAMEDNVFEFSDEINHSEDSEEKISQVDPEFVYPKQIFKSVKIFGEKIKYPMLTTKYVSNRIMTFERH